MRLFVHRPPWYVAGLAFECMECGRCCAGPEEGYVWVTPDDVAKIARHLGLREDEVRRRYVRKVGRRLSLIETEPTRDCVFLAPAEDGREKCSIYPVRPWQCRTWPFWSSNIRSADAWAQAGMRCPGINRGRLYSREEIDAQARSTQE
jgi:hypothetical protein